MRNDFGNVLIRRNDFGYVLICNILDWMECGACASYVGSDNYAKFLYNIQQVHQKIFLCQIFFILKNILFRFRSKLPVVSNLTAMNMWDGVCMFFIYASFIEFILVNYLARWVQVNKSDKITRNFFEPPLVSART